MKNIIFDYDGTLHNSIKIYAPAFRKAYDHLVDEGFAEPRDWKEHEISKWLGYSSKDMWNNFMGHLPEEEKLKCSSIIGEHMVQSMIEGQAHLYEGAIEVLEELKERGYNLIFLSNCKIKYMNEHKRIFNLEKYFHDFYCTEQFEFKPKYEIFKSIKNKYLGEFIVIGDRFVDIEIAKVHNLSSIGCAYGFGTYDELKDADYIAQSVRNILECV